MLLPPSGEVGRVDNRRSQRQCWLSRRPRIALPMVCNVIYGWAEAIHIATLQIHLSNGNLVYVAGDNALLLFSGKFNMLFLEIRVT
jgi:hypothetical protein